MFLQLIGTAIGMNFAPPYACLSVGYLEEIILFSRLLRLHFTWNKCKLVGKISKSFMNKSFALWPTNANVDKYRELLSKLHPSLKLTKEKGKYSCN